MRDGLVGAGITLVALFLVTAGVLWWITDPVPGAGVARPSASGPLTAGGGRPPSDVAPGETWLGDFTLDAQLLATPDALLHDVHAVGDDALAGADGLTAGVLAVDVTVPFEVVAAQIGGRTTLRRADDGAGATLVRTVEVAGRRLQVAATGTIEVVDGQLAIVPTEIDLGGPAPLSRGLAAVARRLVTIEERVEGLPEGLVLQDVRVRDDGLRATLRGEDVVLAP